MGQTWPHVPQRDGESFVVAITAAAVGSPDILAVPDLAYRGPDVTDAGRRKPQPAKTKTKTKTPQSARKKAA